MLRNAFRRSGFFAIGCFTAVLAGFSSPAWPAAESVVVDFGEAAEPTAMPTMTPTVAATPRFSATPTLKEFKAETPVFTDTPVMVAGTFTPSPTVAPSPNAAINDDRDEGVVILSPGSASPEDSLAAFGIESPFETMKNLRAPVGAPAVGGNEEEGAGVALELAAPETTDFKEKISVMTGEGKPVKGLDQYVAAERAGGVLNEDEIRVDGAVIQEKNGRSLIGLGQAIYLRMEEGRQVYPGSEYIVYREDGQVERSVDRKTMGTLMTVNGVIKVTRVEGESPLARVTSIYGDIYPGDKIMLRDPAKLSYLATVRQAREVSGDLNGSIVAVKGNAAMANSGDIVYMDFGRQQGVVPGTKFTAYRPPAESQSNDLSWSEPTHVIGNLGIIEVISTQKTTSTGRVARAGSPLKVGDKLRYR